MKTMTLKKIPINKPFGEHEYQNRYYSDRELKRELIPVVLPPYKHQPDEYERKRKLIEVRAKLREIEAEKVFHR